MFSGIFKWFMNLINKIWNALRKVLSVLLIIVGVALLIWALVSGVWILAAYGMAAIAGAFLIDKDTAEETLSKVGDAVGSVVSTAAGLVGTAAGAGFSALLKSPAGLFLVGLGAYLLLGSDSSNVGAPISDEEGETSLTFNADDEEVFIV